MDEDVWAGSDPALDCRFARNDDGACGAGTGGFSGHSSGKSHIPARMMFVPESFPMRFLAPLALALAPVTLAAALPAPALAQSQSGLAQVRTHLSTVGTMTADFVQTDRNGRSVPGTLTLKRPGKIRFQYQ